MAHQPSLSFLLRQLISRFGWGTCLLILSACSTAQKPSEPEASAEASAASQPTQAEELPADQIPAELLGTFDVSPEVCLASSMTQLTIAPNKLDFYYGFANVDSVAFRDNGYDIDATLFQQEGQVEVVPEAVTYRIELSGQGDLIQFENDWANSEPAPMVRCTRPDSQPSPDGTASKAVTPDKTIELAFASGASSATVSDTISGFNFRDYLVRADANQTLRAALKSDGPALVIVMENDSYQPDAVRGLPANIQEATTNSTGAPTGWLWEGILPRDGVYRVRVIHSGPAANQGSKSPYTLTVEID